ncbi:MAG: sodium-dependent transporter [Deltaproteobacteria bacterium]|nr:sodium-dependent transporter [Deltaproteobacteria bacterium]
MADAPESREQWGSRTGFILAAVGSAVGLGNMWRFSYLTAENGGAAFLVLYLVLVAAVGLPVLLAELVIGRGSRLSPIGALAHYGGSRWRLLGGLFLASGFLILAYYSVIAGWTLRYALTALGGFGPDSGAYFEQVSTGATAVGWHLAFMALTIAIILGGVNRGIERVSIVLMPLLFAIICGIAIYAATLPGADAGYDFYLSIDLAQMLDFKVLAAAASQAFFSLSLGMGAILTYASYVREDENLPNEAVIIATADFAVAFVAGLAVFPLLFALGLESKVGESTLGALFITLPSAFHEMGFAGQVVGTLFFVALVFGALTSAMSLLEVVVATAIDQLGWGRPFATMALGSLCALLGVPAALDLDVLGLMDQIAGSLFLVFGGLMLSIFVGFVMPDPVGEARQGAEGVRWFGAWRLLVRTVVPAVLLVVLWQSIRALR